jgi:hypothetical protein
VVIGAQFVNLYVIDGITEGPTNAQIVPLHCSGKETLVWAK